MNNKQAEKPKLNITIPQFWVLFWIVLILISAWNQNGIAFIFTIMSFLAGSSFMYSSKNEEGK